MKKHTVRKSLKLTISATVIAVGAVVFTFNACTKDNSLANKGSNPANTGAAAATKPANTLTQVLTVATIRSSSSGSNKVMFNENAEVFNIMDAGVLTNLQNALTGHNKVSVTFNPWQATIVSVSELTSDQLVHVTSSPLSNTTGITYTGAQINSMGADKLNDATSLGLLNDKTEGMANRTSVIPDIATAEAIFSYLGRQCCALGGTYNVDYCITYQYCEDGCYARAHMMCFVINNTYHYDTHKVFSFANTGSDELCVEAEKWGGCCINWWYHVAPLVSINTPSGVKAYVIDPAMFDQPVPLSAWLHAQENPACAGSSNPNVSMINIQPTQSFWPADYSGYNFDTDPYYTNTDNTLINYANLVTCP